MGVTRISTACMLYPRIIAFILSMTIVFIRTDIARSTGVVILIMNIYTL